MRYALRFLVSCLLAAATFAPIHAGTVQILVRDDAGAPVEAAGVALEPPYLNSELSSRERWNRSYAGATDAGGSVVFTNVFAGLYEINLRGRTADSFVPPHLNPLAPVQRVSVPEGDGTVSIEVELWRGSPVACRVDVEGAPGREVTIRMRHLDHGVETDLDLRTGSMTRFRVLAGRWEASLLPPEGLVLEDLRIDDREVDGHRVELDLRSPDDPPLVTWKFSAGTGVSGRITFDGEPFPVTIVARLLRAGSWEDTVRRRGGSRVDTVRAEVSPRLASYRLSLPDGRWEISPEGRALGDAQPSSEQLDLVRGETRELDFDVRRREDEPLELVARALDPSGQTRLEATIELWPLDSEERTDRPLATASATRKSDATFYDIEPGDYLIVATNPRYLEGRVTVEDPGRERPPVQEIRLQPAAVVRAAANAADGTPAGGVRIRLERLGAPPPMTRTDTEAVRRATRIAGVTDATGRLVIEGVWPGRYRVVGELQSARTSSPFVLFREGDSWVPRLTFRADGDAPTELAARIVPAATVTGRLTCSDGGWLPPAAAVHAWKSDLDLESMNAAQLDTATSLAMDQAVLSGSGRSTFRAAPLAPGTYRLAVRPAGFDRWTWLPGVENMAGAEPLSVESVGDRDVGPLTIDCGPAVRISLDLPDGTKLPGFTSADAVEVRRRDAEQAMRELTVDPLGEAIVVRGLPVDSARLVATIRNGYLLPAGEVTLPIDGALERGRTLEISVPAGDVGGMLRLRDRLAPAASVVAGDGTVRVEPFIEGDARFESLPSGSYGVSLCSDASCREVTRTWDAVGVETARTTELEGS